MKKKDIIEAISARGGGEIYLGVVGPVRVGKSTFIKRFIENLVVPNISDEFTKKKCLDEIPQTAEGKTIMTTEPKFVPSNGAVISIDKFETNIKLVDCVGYVIKDANGYEDENGNPRMVKTPWFPDSIPFIEAAEIGTQKVIEDHATIGIVVTTDGSFGELNRSSYIEAEEKIVEELTQINKPFIVLLNSKTPNADKTIELKDELESKYQVPVVPLDIENMREADIMNVLRISLDEFPVIDIEFNMPKWISALPNSSDIKLSYISSIKNTVTTVNKLKDVNDVIKNFENNDYIKEAYISELNPSTGIVKINICEKDNLFSDVLSSIIGDEQMTRSRVINIFTTYKETKEEYESVKKAMVMADTTGYGILYPTLKDMRLQTPEVIKQGSRYGVKLKAIASSFHLIKVDVESTFEPIIGSETQSKELIDYIMKDYETNPEEIWHSEIFGRSLDAIVKEGIQAKLSLMPDHTRNKLSQTVTKIVNKGANNLIAIVI
ncbi:MAG: stage IV sporulation protein A [Bacilli bacterium]|nr:stage IV sporulation protein A [Bacilli bacterium]